MEKNIQLLKVRSEIAAGTRGARMGVDALEVASILKGSSLFASLPSIEIKDVNELLLKQNKYPNAKYIDGVATMLERVSNGVNSIFEEGNFPVILAGDHSTAAGTICGIKKQYPNKRIGAIWIDAHADLHTPYTTPSGNMHGMPLSMVTDTNNLECKVNSPSEETIDHWNHIKNIGVEGAKMNLEDIVFIAVRDTESPEDHLMKKHGIRNFTVAEVRELGTRAIVDKVLEKLTDCDLIYVSFDVDSMDSAISAGTGTPVPNGLSVEEAREINQYLVESPKVCAWEMVEVNPTLDRLNTMAENAFSILENTIDHLHNSELV
ncbi:arginase [Sediminitomix flava]|uniref:Arginase n=1 Tax=Sediminitomix flava TaxID=379075 RepID=A0A315ZB28_SEDFL|nr:arginase [Sediminitomix flava]PWJ42560.1 arginase [Sediminitomix flava]